MSFVYALLRRIKNFLNAATRWYGYTEYVYTYVYIITA